ncbi:MAG: tetratricopeptide repeat protein [Acidobacteriota bacterium]|nr:MAG: tetratricopeptide repeat protein [Acidobacteriota bacterium]
MTKSSVPAVSTLMAIVALMGASCLSGCATPVQGRSVATTDAAEIRDQLFKLQKDSARLIESIERIEQRGGNAMSSNACAEAVTKIESVERRVLVLEEQLLAAHQRLDQTLAELRAIRISGGLAWSGTGSSTWDEGTGTPELPPAQPPAGQERPDAGDLSASEMFNAAYADYSRGKFDLALAGFEAALRQDAGGPLADDAQFWVGETLFAMGRYEQAAEAFERVISDYGVPEKMPAAHLKKGLALFEARDTAAGVQELQYVIRTWPASDEARIAREYFKRKGIVAE